MNFEAAKKSDTKTSETKNIALPANTSAAWSDLVAFWTDRRWAEKAWPFPNSNDTAGVTEHALKTYRTLLMANQAAAEVLCETARRQQELTFGIARSALNVYPQTAAGAGGQGPDAAWKRVMAGYAEVYNESLGVTHAMTEAAFKVLSRAPAAALAGKTEERPTP
jgi:hypothetical protein